MDYARQTFEWGVMVNDLERPVFEKYLLLPELKTWLRTQPGVRGALMSGSGSTMIAVLTNAAEAANVASRATEQFGELWTSACATV